MKILWTVAVAVMLAVGIGRAAPSDSFFPYKYTLEKFPNGLQLVTVPTDYPNLAAVYIVVRVGSRNEVEPGKSGFAHFFEHMMFRGSEQYTPEQRDAILKKAGAEVNAYTEDDRTVYHELFAKENLEDVLKIEADRFQHLKYPESAFRTEALAVLGEYNKNNANPINKLEEVLREKAFDAHTYKHTTMGFIKDIEDMPNQYQYSQEFYARFYRPENATIVIVGDVKPANVKSLVQKYFGDWKAGDYKPAIAPEPAQKGPRTGKRRLACAHTAVSRSRLSWSSVFGCEKGQGGSRFCFAGRFRRGFGALPKAGLERAESGHAGAVVQQSD